MFVQTKGDQSLYIYSKNAALKPHIITRSLGNRHLGTNFLIVNQGVYKISTLCFKKWYTNLSTFPTLKIV